MRLFAVLLLLSMYACQQNDKAEVVSELQQVKDTIKQETKSSSGTESNEPKKPFSGKKIETGRTTPDELLAYAQTLIGTPYLYGSTDPKAGFDCSGFITHVFNHFGISVPRSSKDFTDVETEVPVSDAKPGDLVLFTGTDSSIRDVGHMGIIIGGVNEEVRFIHSTSGKQHGVTITPLNKYYMGRFVKVIRVFKQDL